MARGTHWLLLMLLAVPAPLLSSCASRPVARGPLVGGPAPPLTVSQWLKGGPVESFEPGKVYVLDIWAPWCGPCLAMMPELSDLQERHQADGLVVVGLTGVDDYGSTLETARRALDERGDRVRYAIAWDRERESYQRWMAYESDSGWPWCFIVDRRGRIAFTGHPGRLPEVLGPILDGTWNLDSARTAYAHRVEGLDRAAKFMAAYRAHRFDQARARYAALEAHDRDMAGEYAAAMFEMLLVAEGRPGDAAAFARRVLPSMGPAHVGTLVAMVEMELDETLPPVRRDLDLALEIATRARGLAAPDDSGAIGTVAQVEAMRAANAAR